MTIEERARVLAEVGTVCILGCKGKCVSCRVRRAIGFEDFDAVFAFYEDHGELINSLAEGNRNV